ncbi:MAG: efflux RND transporter periplasmic adaptor subunit [Pseudomonadota bacterium]|nr:efflux RND transporter periplasmic adaptor subunit [Gammaproteobacteria bacterium]MDQ3581791.1 efflux RND transporter periplasmic adaptor subunit [Pseudomonadota bacterium]
MNKFIPSLLALLLVTACDRTPTSDSGQGPGGGHVSDEAKPEPAKGPHRGRLLTDGDFQIEVTIFESGVPPEFHVYAREAGKPVNPSDVKLAIELRRLGGRVDRLTFMPENDYLKGSGTVAEPHSFDVKVEAEHAGVKHVWTYDSYEGRTTIAADMAKAGGIETAVAGPAVLRETLTLYGTIEPNAERVRSVTARFPGPIRSVSKQIGDRVKASDTLATVESNESLQTYAVTAPISGVVTQRSANPGESAGSEPLFVISDFGSVWAELTVFPRERPRLRAGQPVTVSATDGEQTGEGAIGYISPVGTAANQSLVARVVLDNARGQWTPGLFVTGNVTVGEIRVDLAVPDEALQTFRDFTVVFAQVGETYEVRMLELGASDGEVTEVLGGLEPGTLYVTENSYLIKADIEKTAASHDH